MGTQVANGNSKPEMGDTNKSEGGVVRPEAGGAINGIHSHFSHEQQALQQAALTWAWEQGLPRLDRLPQASAQLLTPALASAFGIQLMNRYPFTQPPQQPQARVAGAAQAGDLQQQQRAAQQAPMQPPQYPSFHHGMHAPPSAQAAAAAAAVAQMQQSHPGHAYQSYHQQASMQQHYGAHAPPPPQQQRGYHPEMFGRPCNGHNPQQGARSWALSWGGRHCNAPSKAPAQKHFFALVGYFHFFLLLHSLSPSLRANTAGAMDPSTVSYEQMIAYQAGVEHSRSFEAFKRSRDEPSASLGMEGERIAL